MSSEPKTKVWNKNEGRFTRRNEQETENDGGQNEGPNYRNQNPGQQNRRRNQGPQNRVHTPGQQDQDQNHRQQDRGQNPGQQNRGQNSGQHNRGGYSRQQVRGQNYGQQDRGQNYGQQDRSQNYGQQDRNQNYGQQDRGQNYGQQDRGQNYGQQDRGQNYRQQDRGQSYRQQDGGQYSGQQGRDRYPGQPDRGQYSGQQDRGQYSGQQNRGQNSGQQSWGHQDGLLPNPPPNMQYQPMMTPAPIVYPYMMQPMYPMCPIPPPPGPPPGPPPLLRDPVPNFDRRQGRQHANRGFPLPPQENLGMNGNMRRSTSMRSVNTDEPQVEGNCRQNSRPINNRGRKRSNRPNISNDRPNNDGNLYKSASVSHIDIVGRELGARPKQRTCTSNEQDVDSDSNQGEQAVRGNVKGRNTDRERGSARGRGTGGERGRGRGSDGKTGTGRGGRTDEQRGTGRGRGSGRGRGYERGRDSGRGRNFERGRGTGRGRGRPYNRRVSSDSDESDIQSVSSFADEKDTEEKIIHGHLFNNIRRGYGGPKMCGITARERRNFVGRGYGPRRGRLERFEQERPEYTGYRPRGGFRGRGRGYFRGGRGKFFAGRWSQLINRKEDTRTDGSKDDLRSLEQQDDFDDAVSITSDISIATSSLADLSEAGIEDQKCFEISLDDIHSVKLATLKNRLMRYKKKLSNMRKEDVDENEIRKYQDAINVIRKVIKERETLKRKEREEKNKDNNAKPEQETKRDNNGSSAEQLSTSSSEDDEEKEVKSKQVLTKSKRVHVVTVVKGHVSYKPKSRNKSIGKQKVKKYVESSETECEDEVEDDVQETDKKKNDPQQMKKQTKTRNRRNKRKNKENEVINEDKTTCSEEDKKRLIDILSGLDSLGKQKNVSETKQADFIDSRSEGIGAQSRSRGNSVNDSNDLPKGHCHDDHTAANTKKAKVEKVRKTSESNVQGPDVNEVFKFMVKTLEGKGSPEEIKRESGLFPIDLEENTWFRRHKNRFTLIERDGVVVTVLVLNRDATYCLDYITNRSCKKEDCKRYHICKHLLNGNCAYGERCKFSHDFLDERNISVSKRLGYGNVFSNDEICSILKVRYPHTCSYWIENGSCEDRGCIGLHLCPQFILGQCFEAETCPLVHNKFSEHNKPVVDAYGMSKFPEGLFRKMIYMSRQLELEARDVDKDENNHKNDPEDLNGQASQELYNREKLTRQKETEESAINKPICERYLIGKCHRHNCKFLHSSVLSPYIWQVKLSGTWINLKELEEIEQLFCNNQEFYEDIRLVHNDMEFSVQLIFRPQIQAVMKLIGMSDGGERVEARRLSTLSYKDGGGSSESFKTQWRWYWKDDQNRWQLFEPDALQHTLEVKFLANQKEFNYSRDNYRFKYILDFKGMTQRNIDTHKRRYIHRCPVFVSQDDVKNKHYPPPLAVAPVIETPLPQSWVPWDLAHPFELVRIDQNDPKYVQVSDSFFSTLDRGMIRIDAIFRMQNHKLWTLFCNQERSMEANLKRIGNETVVDKRYLFHGTDSLDAVRGISINNFDVRVSGKNATMYGDGAYFARDAKYSHSYTRGPDRLMFMVTVLVGHYTKGDKSYRRPPNKPGSDHELYDSCVNDMANPSIFIVFDKNQYYPEYLIQYHKLYEEVDPVMPYSSYTSSASSTAGTGRPSSGRPVPQQSAPVIPPRRVPSSPTDTSFPRSGYTVNQNTGAQAAYPGSSVPTPTSHPRDDASAKKKDDSSCSIQ